VVEGGRTRLRPILMTALTTILALVPLALGWGSGGESWSPMARSVIGGLAASTMLTLFVIPVIYTYLSPKRLRQSAKTNFLV
jgi:HAE1 family hydrophobic/amphiphilic exporter-1